MFFDTKIAMLTGSLCRTKALWFLSDCELWDKVIKLALTSYTRDLCLVSARILCCDRSFEILLSHKTFSLFSFSGHTENLLVIQTKYHSSLLFTFPSFWVVFLSFHCLKAFFFFFFRQLLKQATYQWQTYLDTMPAGAKNLWNSHVVLERWHYDIWYILHSWVKRLFLSWSPSINAWQIHLKTLLNAVRGFCGRCFGRALQNLKVIQTKQVAWFWVQPHACRSFGFSGVSPSLRKGERMRVKLTNITLIAANLHVKPRRTTQQGDDPALFEVVLALSNFCLLAILFSAVWFHASDSTKVITCIWFAFGLGGILCFQNWAKLEKNYILSKS